MRCKFSTQLYLCRKHYRLDYRHARNWFVLKFNFEMGQQRFQMEAALAQKVGKDSLFCLLWHDVDWCCCCCCCCCCCRRRRRFCFWGNAWNKLRLDDIHETEETVFWKKQNTKWGKEEKEKRRSPSFCVPLFRACSNFGKITIRNIPSDLKASKLSTKNGATNLVRALTKYGLIWWS